MLARKVELHHGLAAANGVSVHQPGHRNALPVVVRAVRAPKIAEKDHLATEDLNHSVLPRDLDIAEREQVDAAFAQPFDVIFHLAAVVSGQA